MKASQAAYQLIKDFESLRLKAYLCPARKLTIGWGHVIMPRFDAHLFAFSAEALSLIKAECQNKGVLTHDASLLVINEVKAQHLLDRDINQISLFLNSVGLSELKQNPYDALVSFVFNVGQGNFATSTLRKKLRNEDFLGAADEFDRWVYGTVNGKKQKVNGLVARRAREKTLFLS